MFCGLVYYEIYKVSNLLTAWCKQEIEMVLDEEFKAKVSKVPHNIRIHSSQKSSVFSILSDNNKPTFEEALANFNSFNKTLARASKDMHEMRKAIDNIPELQKVIDSIRPME